MRKLLLIVGVAFGLNAGTALAQHENMPGHDMPGHDNDMPGGHDNMPHGDHGKHNKKKHGATDKREPPKTDDQKREEHEQP